MTSNHCEKNKEEANFPLAFLLISLGVAFLAKNLNFVTEKQLLILWQFWPSVLVLWGLDLFLGKSWMAKTLMVVFTLLAIAVVFYLTFIDPSMLNLWRSGKSL